MPTQEEIKAAIERVKSDKEAIHFVRGPVTQIFDWQTLADAYIAGHDDTPITLDEATELCKGSKYIMVATFTGSDVFAEIGTKDMTDYFHVEIKSRSQLLALLKGLGD